MPSHKPTAMTLAATLAASSLHWEDRKGGSVMVTRAARCVALMKDEGVTSTTGLSAGTGVILLKELRRVGLSAKSVADYYGTFRRMLALQGVVTIDWPKAPTPPRKTRDALSKADIERLIGHLDGVGQGETGDLARLLYATGARVSIEGLTEGAIRVSQGDSYDILHITGKGGHERTIPVVDGPCRLLLADSERMGNLRALGYSAHLKRWKRATQALGITSRLPTPHAMRHSYLTEALSKSGGNLAMVQELAGHSDPATTARYLSVDLDAKAKALSKAS